MNAPIRVIVGCTQGLPFGSGESQTGRREECFREYGTEIQRWTLIDVWQLVNVLQSGVVYCWKEIFLSIVNMKSLVWLAES